MQVQVDGALYIEGPPTGQSTLTGISSQATSGSTGKAGDVRVQAGNLSIVRRGQIEAATRGAGDAGNVTVVVPGALTIEGSGGAFFAGISSTAEANSTGNAGQVVVQAGSLTLRNAGVINSNTNGPGQGGHVAVTAGDIQLSGPRSRITTTSAGTGNAGSITVSTPRLRLRDGASISTEAQTANGGNITLTVSDLLYLQRSSITTSVNGALGNGGNITINPQFVVLDRSSLIKANAVGGAGGKVTISAGQLLRSPGSEITAFSGRPNLSGTITIANPPPNLTGSLVVLASELRAATALLQESCATQGARLRSSLVVAGRGGQHQSVETTVPALYIADRPVRTDQEHALEIPPSPLHTNVTLSIQCS